MRFVCFAITPSGVRVLRDKKLGSSRIDGPCRQRHRRFEQRLLSNLNLTQSYQTMKKKWENLMHAGRKYTFL